MFSNLDECPSVAADVVLVSVAVAVVGFEAGLCASAATAAAVAAAADRRC